MADVAAVLSANGILDPASTLAAANAAGIPLAAACVVLMDETGGGRMIWGHDRVSTGGLYTNGGPVTQSNYLAYRAAVQAGRIGRQGCGPCQLTSAGYQDRGDALGGCWNMVANMRAGFEGLAAGIRAHGVQLGFQNYNGSGPAAVAYGLRSLAAYSTWQQRLAGTTTTAPTTHHGENMIDNHEVSGNGDLKLNCPVGSASAITAAAWVSASLGDATTGAVQLWAQDDKGGTLHEVDWALTSTAGHSNRPVVQLPDGTTEVNIHYQFNGPGVITLETQSK